MRHLVVKTSTSIYLLQTSVSCSVTTITAPSIGEGEFSGSATPIHIQIITKHFTFVLRAFQGLCIPLRVVVTFIQHFQLLQKNGLQSRQVKSFEEKILGFG